MTKTIILTLRGTEQQKKQIEKAAKDAGTSLNSYVLSAVVETPAAHYPDDYDPALRGDLKTYKCRSCDYSAASPHAKCPRHPGALV